MMVSSVACCVLALVLSAAVPASQSGDAQALVAQGYALVEQSKLADARKTFDSALMQARASSDRQAEADAQRGIGLVLYQQGKWNDAPAPLEAARALYLTLGDRLGEARTLDVLGSAGAMTRKPDARDHYERAIAIFADAGEKLDQARTIRNMSHLPQVPMADKLIMLERAYALAAGDARLQGLILHSWGSLLQTQAQYGAALERFEQARPLLERAGSPRERARLMGSMGGSYHLHGVSERAIEVYLEALALQAQIGDEAGQSQTAQHLAEAYVAVGQPRKSLEYRERALVHAQRTGSPGMIATTMGTLGQAYVALGEFARAIPLMEDALGKDQFSDVTTGFYRHLARAYAGVGRFDDAIAMATRGVDRAREKGRTQIEMGSLHVRAMVYDQMGMTDRALADARAGLDALEELRTNLAPTDYLKSGFADDFQSLFALTIHLLDKSGRAADAVAIAEQARARAFLDLLASRDAGASATAARASPLPVPATSTPAGPPSLLTMRGGVPAVLAEGHATRSELSAPVPTAATLQQVAQRIQSTLLSFWVGDDATLVWVVTPAGKVTSHRAPLSRTQVTALVRRTWSLSDGATTRGASAAGDPLAFVTLRGGGRLDPIDAGRNAYRELYDALIRPVRQALPSSAGSLLTIIPHGPLFELSFAALQDARGRYLLEDYRLHYSPSAAVLAFTERTGAAASSGYLFVANPSLAHTLTPEKLPALPGAEREVQAVARMLRGREEVTTLTGAMASETAIRDAIGRHRVVHFATHGLVSSDRPFDSFLALASAGSDRAADGRLTAAEIYNLHVSADLVVLSACRAAGGRISGDGIIGLTRAFFSAGTPSILAALWDFADESAEHLLPRFYAEWLRGGDKSEALRTAQLAMLRDLRAGKIKVSTPVGPLALPPHPALWANLVLLGEPQ